jgi:hypothetical protein
VSQCTRTRSEQPSRQLGESEPKRWAVLCCFVRFRTGRCSQYCATR